MYLEMILIVTMVTISAIVTITLINVPRDDELGALLVHSGFTVTLCLSRGVQSEGRGLASFSKNVKI